MVHYVNYVSNSEPRFQAETSHPGLHYLRLAMSGEPERNGGDYVKCVRIMIA